MSSPMKFKIDKRYQLGEKLRQQYGYEVFNKVSDRIMLQATFMARQQVSEQVFNTVLHRTIIMELSCVAVRFLMEEI